MPLGRTVYFTPSIHQAIHSGNPSFHLTMNRIVLSVAGFDVGNYSLFPLLINQGLESMNSLAQKCMQLKPMSSTHRLIELMVGILGENTEVCIIGDYQYQFCLALLAFLLSKPKMFSEMI